MNKKLLIIFLPIIFIIVFIGCREKVAPDSNGTIKKPNVTVAPIPKTPIPEDQVTKMTLDEKIGQMIIVGVDSYTNDLHSQELIKQYHVGGFVLLGQNIKDTQQTLDLINSLKETNRLSQNKVPLFLSVDEEGGRITRMPLEFSRLPTNKAIGKANNSKLSFKIGQLLGTEVKAFGYNMDFAPVLDINSNPKNPVIGDRSFGSSPVVVTKLGIETIKGIYSQNIIPVVKHFPGHGDTSVDSHTGLPIVRADLDRLREFELIPFNAAIKNNIEVIMVAHILFPKIDAANPASLSEKIITGILKEELGYRGLIITDDMTMGAIIKQYDIGDAAVKSIKAGTDIILVCHDFNKEVAVFNALKTAVEKGQLTETEIDSKVHKILKLKEKYKITDEKTETVDVKGINNKIKDITDTMRKL